MRGKIAVAFVCLLAACSSGSSSSKSTHAPAPTYTPAAQGAPIGTAVTQNVDASGGTVSSADGRLVITIPAGALSASTAITIQPITNTAPNGVDDSYLLGPEGTTFAQPVTLAFHQSAAEAPALASSFIATQHADNFWYAQSKTATDAGANTLSVTTTHFSPWGIVQTLRLAPQTANVKVNMEQNFTSSVVPDYVAENPDQDESKIADSVPAGTDELGGDVSWAVNGEPDGGSAVGHVNGIAPSSDPTKGEQSYHAVYTAPDTVPSPDTVTVSMTGSVPFANGKSVQVTATAQVKITSGDSWTGHATGTYADGSSFTADFTFEELPNDTGPDQHYKIKDGTVVFTPPPVVSGDCTETVAPDNYAMGPNEGTMTVTTTTDSTGSPHLTVAGQGASVWEATYTVTCPGQPSGTQQLPVQVQWWPLNPSGPPETFDATGGNAAFDVTAAGGTAHITLSESP